MFIYCLYFVLISVTVSDLAAATDLANGFVKTNNNVDSFAAIASDLSDASVACDQELIFGAETIYKDGRNSEYLFKEGYRTLQKFSTESEDDFSLPYAFQIYGVTSRKGSELGNTTTSEFDVFVMNLFDKVEAEGNNEFCYDALEAARAMNLWMHTVYLLWNNMKCDETCIASDDSSEKADQFIAFWIGSEQEFPDDATGYSLFAMAHEVAVEFDTINDSGVAKVNENIRSLYEQLSLELRDMHGGTMKQVWVLNNMITSQMMVPLIQKLIKYMSLDDQDKIDIYASIVIPQLSQCRKSIYDFLSAKLLDTPYDKLEYYFIRDQIYQSLECLGLTCEDIGIYDVDDPRKCFQNKRAKLTSYYPTSDVRMQAKIDLDVHQMEILLKFDSDDVWDMARNIYSYGKNSIILPKSDDEPLEELDRMSFEMMATTDLSGSQYYNTFNLYFDTETFAHNGIIETFRNEGKWAGRTREQRAGFILTTMTTSVIWMYISSELNDAVMDCNNEVDVSNVGGVNDNAGGSNAWDEVAAYIIGSLEGDEEGGSDDFEDGNLLWNLANKRAVEFDRLNSKGYALINRLILNLLLGGKGEIQVRDCNELKLTANRLELTLLLPIMQSVLRNAIFNEGVIYYSSEVSILEGEANANAILPVIDSMDHHYAKKIKQNMVVDPHRSELLVQNGAQKVADFYLSVISNFGVQCEYIGKSNGVDACLNFEPSLLVDDTERYGVENEETEKSYSFQARTSYMVLSTVIVICSYLLY